MGKHRAPESEVDGIQIETEAGEPQTVERVWEHSGTGHWTAADEYRGDDEQIRNFLSHFEI